MADPGNVPVKGPAQSKSFDMSDYGINEASNLAIQDALADYVKKAFNDAAQHRRGVGIDDRLIRNLRANKCQYQPDELGLLGPFNDVYIGLCALKARAAESWLIDIVLNNIEKPWTLSPSPDPDLPESEAERAVSILLNELPGLKSIEALRDRARELKGAMQNQEYSKAEYASRRMETVVNDQLTEGGWTPEYTGLIQELAVYPSAFMRGPVVVAQKKGTWKDDKYQIKDMQVPTVHNIPAFDAYPSADSTTTQNGQFFIERRKFRQSELYDLIGVKGFNTENIRQCLDRYESGYKLNEIYDAERERLEKTDSNIVLPEDPPGETLDGIIYNGKVRGQLLADHGVLVKDPQKWYEAEVYLIGSYVVRAVLNPNPMGKRPIWSTSYRKVKGSIWGQSVIDLVYDLQRVCNAACRSLVRNMGYSSGPIGEVVAERVSESQDPFDLTPYRIVGVGPDMSGTGQRAYHFHNVQSIAPDLMNTIDRFMKYADDVSGVPAYVLGNPQVAGAGRTMGGLSMLMGNAAKGIKNVQLNIDNDVTTGIVSGFVTYNMLTSDDNSIKADSTVIARGATGLLQRELAQTRTVEILQLLAPYIENWENLPQGVLIMIREILKNTGLPVDDIIPDPLKGRELEGISGALNRGADYGGTGGQAQSFARGTSSPVPLPPQSQPPMPMPTGGAPTPVNLAQGA